MNKNLLEVLNSDFIKDMDIKIYEWFTVDDTELYDFKVIDELIGGYVLEGNLEVLKEYIVDEITINPETLKKAYIHCSRREVN